jgi:hypothetical protein
MLNCPYDALQYSKARVSIEIAHLGHAFSEHIYSFREGLADFLILLQAFDHHGGQIRDQLFMANVLLS